MPLEVRRFQAADERHWEEFVQRANNGTLFHERRFLSYHPPERFRDHSLLLWREGRLLALFPAAERQVNGERWLVSHPGASYGGPVYLPDLTFRQSFDCVAALKAYAQAQGFHRLVLTLPPAIYQQRVSQYIDFALLKHSFSYLKREVSSMLEIAHSDEAILAAFRPTHRTAVRKAQRAGVEIRQSEDWAEFYQILQRNLKIRHGVAPTHTLEELLRLKELYPERILLFGSYWQGRLTAGVVLFLVNSRVALAFYISHDEAFQHLRPLNLLFYRVLCWCREQGYTYLDFGIFTVDMEPNFGLARFKENFGASGVFRDTFICDLKAP